ncbi:hypothetical protein [Gracilibacillus saliphilus]|nr:hypothetical protein [Gracilibacillus saliphilus]
MYLLIITYYIDIIIVSYVLSVDELIANDRGVMDSATENTIGYDPVK